MERRSEYMYGTELLKLARACVWRGLKERTRKKKWENC